MDSRNNGRREIDDIKNKFFQGVLNYGMDRNGVVVGTERELQVLTGV